MAPVALQPHMSIAARVLLLALVLVFGAALSVACADVFCASCDSVCCTGADRSRPLSRLVTRLRICFASTFSGLMSLIASASQRLCALSVAVMPTPPALKVAALRI